MKVHELSLAAKSTGYLVEFNLEFYRLNHRGMNDLLQRTAKLNLCKVSKSSSHKLYAILQSILLEYCEAKNRYNEIIRAQLDIFFIELL